MASVKFSALISDIRGFLNNQIFSRNHYGAYVKNYAAKPDENTGFQQDERAIFRSVTVNWNAITESEREQWRQAATCFPKKNIFGDTYYPDGFHFFISCNKNLRLCGCNQIPIPSMDNNVSAISSFIITHKPPPDEEIMLNFPGEGTNDKIRCLAYSTGYMRPGINYAQNKYRMIDLMFENTSNQWNAYNGVSNYYGNPISNTKIFIKIRAINILSGFSAVPVHNSFIFP